MNILHISDLHFGTRHWNGDTEVLLDKINSYPTDLVINTGDSTSDGLESEYQDAARFLQKITCENVISVVGNHDKRNMHSHEYFAKYIDPGEVILPLNPELTVKKEIYLQRDITKVDNYFTDLNYIKMLTFNGKTMLVICLDSNILCEDEGFVEEEILRSMSKKIKLLEYETSIMLIHHSILSGDVTPLLNPLLLTAFVREHGVEAVFCGHTHRVDLRKNTDLYFDSTFTQYMVGSLSSSNRVGDDNNFLFLEDWGTPNMQIHLIRIILNAGGMSFVEEVIF